MNQEVIQIKLGKTNTYLILTDKGYILIDAGVKKKTQVIEEILEKKGVKPREIQLIIITHVHYDHVGSLKALKEMTNAPVLVHLSESESLVSGLTDFPKGTKMFSKVISKLANLFVKGSFDAVIPDILIDGSYDLDEFGIKGEVLYTPGHTKGSLCVLIESEHLFCGDTFFNVSKETVYPPFADNEKQLIESWIRLKEKNPKVFYPGHGEMFLNKKFLKTLEEIIIHS